ncbi:MAG TPA: amidohydrolase family protein [Chloroflexota bacterium]|nr:amidohydrolase family protein [Chloroflexota bacterium]
MATGETSLLVRGRWVVTGAGQDDATVTDGAVLVHGNRIEGVGAWDALRAAHPDAEVLGSDRVAVLPGMISGHHHAGGVSHLQQGVLDDVLEPWLLELRRMRPTDAYLDVLLTSARLLRSGVTGVVEMHACRGTAASSAERVTGALRGFDEAGIRVAFAPGVADQNTLVSVARADEEQAFVAGLPPDARAAAEAMLPGPDFMRPDEYFSLMDALWAQYGEHPRIDVWFGPQGPNWVSDAFMVQTAERMARYDQSKTGIQTHVAESLYEKLYGPRTHGESVVLHLKRLGVLGPRFSLAHAVWLSEAEIAVLAETGTAVSHNPSSNLKLRAGVLPARALVEAGATVGLGLDGHALDDDDDIFREMRLAWTLQRDPRIGTPTLAPRQVFQLATTGSARLMGKDGLLGRLAPGYAADLVLVDLDRLTWPWVAPEADPRDLLVLRAQARDVRTVLVDGEVVLQDGLPTRFDLAAAGREYAERMAALPFPSETAARVALVKPHLEAFYQSWDVPELDPYVRQNSRT